MTVLGVCIPLRMLPFSNILEDSVVSIFMTIEFGSVGRRGDLNGGIVSVC